MAISIVATNVYATYDALYFTVIDAPAVEVSERLWREHRHPTVTPQRQVVFDDLAIEPTVAIPPETACSFHRNIVPFDLRWAYSNVPRQGWRPMQLLLWEPRNHPAHTVIMGNGPDGDQHATGPIADLVPWTIVFIAIVDGPNTIPAYEINFVTDHSHIVRSIAAAVDYEHSTRRWLFVTDGPIQKFENPAYYKRRKIADRLNREILTEYLLKMGYDIQSDDFWSTDQPAWLIWYDAGGKKTRPVRYGVDE